MYKYDKDTLKENLSIEEVFDLVSELGGEPIMGNGLFTARTICHGGDSHKLYYYLNTHLFHCYTGCGDSSFDIYELVLKVNKNAGIQNFTLSKAISFVARYFGYTAETFEFTAELLNKGVNVSDVYKRVMQTISKDKFELRKLAMERTEFIEDGKIAFTYINQEDEKRVNAGIDAHEGIVELGRDVEGVEISILLRENKERDGYKISLRSNEYANVADICFVFGGGGHARAAGGSIKLPLEQAKQKIIEECKRHIK